MKIIKAVVLVLALFVSTVSLAKGEEEFCYEVAEADVFLKKELLSAPNYLKGLLAHIEKQEIKPKVKAIMRERIFWVYNNKDLSDSLLWKLSYLQCSARS